MFNAKDASNLTRLAKHKSQLENVLHDIENAAKLGNNTVKYTNALDSIVITELEKLGFKWRYNESNLLIISWY